MLFSDITVLIAEDDLPLSQLWEYICTEIGFSVLTTQTVREGISLVKKAHILIADMILADGRADLIISNWMEHNGGPFVCVSGKLNDEEIQSTILNGAYNAFTKTDFTNEMVRTLMTRYGKWMLLQLKFEKLEQKIRRQQYAIYALAALVLGKELWSILAPLFV